MLGNSFIRWFFTSAIEFIRLVVIRALLIGKSSSLLLFPFLLLPLFFFLFQFHLFLNSFLILLLSSILYFLLMLQIVCFVLINLINNEGWLFNCVFYADYVSLEQLLNLNPIELDPSNPALLFLGSEVNHSICNLSFNNFQILVLLFSFLHNLLSFYLSLIEIIAFVLQYRIKILNNLVS